MTFLSYFFLLCRVYPKNTMKELQNIVSKKVFGETLTKAEAEIFSKWVNNSSNSDIYMRLKSCELTQVILEMENEGLGKEMSKEFSHSIQLIKKREKKSALLRVVYAVSAAAVLALSFLVYNGYDSSTNKLIVSNLNHLTTSRNVIEADDSIKLITSEAVLNLDKKVDFMNDGRVVVNKNDNQIFLTRFDSALVNVAPQMSTLVVPLKRECNFILPDGSKVWINSGSTLVFPEYFSDTLRCVELVGEAYFEIVKNEKAPFVVLTNEMSTSVIGTQFMVSSYDGKHEVALIEGSVRVNRNGTSQNITLKPGRGVVLGRNAKELREVDIDIEKILERKNGFLFFDEEKLDDIVSDLRRWYGVNFIFETEELRNQTFYIKINRNDSIQYIMQLLKFTNKIDYEIEDNRVIIKSMRL